MPGLLVLRGTGRIVWHRIPDHFPVLGGCMPALAVPDLVQCPEPGLRANTGGIPRPPLQSVPLAAWGGTGGCMGNIHRHNDCCYPVAMQIPPPMRSKHE